MASALESKHAEAEDEESSDEEGGSLLDASTVLRLLADFVGEPHEVDAQTLERAGALLWDLTATQEHARAAAAHVGALADASEREGVTERWREVALGVLGNVAGWAPGVLSERGVQVLAAKALAESDDPGVLAEASRLAQTAALVLAPDRKDRSSPAKGVADSWAAIVRSLADRVVFFAANSLDARLVARALDLCFACRFFLDATGAPDVFDALCEDDALLGAALDAADPTGGVGVEDLEAARLDNDADGLDAALRVLELCSLRVDELEARGLRGKRREGAPARRARAVAALRDLVASDRRDRDLATATIALANFAPSPSELRTGRSPSGLVAGLTRALDVGLAQSSPAPEGADPAGPAAAAAAYLLRAVFKQGDEATFSLDEEDLVALEDACTRGKARGLAVPEFRRERPGDPKTGAEAMAAVDRTSQDVVDRLLKAHGGKLPPGGAVFSSSGQMPAGFKMPPAPPL